MKSLNMSQNHCQCHCQYIDKRHREPRQQRWRLIQIKESKIHHEGVEKHSSFSHFKGATLKVKAKLPALMANGFLSKTNSTDGTDKSPGSTIDNTSQ